MPNLAFVLFDELKPNRCDAFLLHHLQNAYKINLKMRYFAF